MDLPTADGCPPRALPVLRLTGGRLLPGLSLGSSSAKTGILGATLAEPVAHSHPCHPAAGCFAGGDSCPRKAPCRSTRGEGLRSGVMLLSILPFTPGPWLRREAPTPHHDRCQIRQDVVQLRQISAGGDWAGPWTCAGWPRTRSRRPAGLRGCRDEARCRWAN